MGSPYGMSNGLYAAAMQGKTHTQPKTLAIEYHTLVNTEDGSTTEVFSIINVFSGEHDFYDRIIVDRLDFLPKEIYTKWLMLMAGGPHNSIEGVGTHGRQGYVSIPNAAITKKDPLEFTWK